MEEWHYSCTHYLAEIAKEEQSTHTKSFWSGKLLQVLPEDVILRSKHYSQEGGGEDLTTPCSPLGPINQLHSPPASHHQLEQQEYSETLVQSTDESTATSLAQDSRKDSTDVIFRLIGTRREPLWFHVMRAEESLRLTHDPVSHCSSLSSVVRNLVVDSMTEPYPLVTPPPSSPTLPPPPSSLDSALNTGNTLDWTQVALFLGTDVIRERRDYGRGAFKCAALARHVSSVLVNSQLSGVTLWNSLFAWTGHHQRLFVDCLQHMMSESNHMIHRQEVTHIHFLLCSAGLERALGDVYLSVSGVSQCPSLLRDLLNTSHLEDTFGNTAMCCLRCLIGPPSGLNLRNLFWHGFPCPGEISSNYLILLLVMVASLGQTLQSTGVEVTHRLPLSLEKEEGIMAATFPELCEREVSCVEKLFTESYFVPPGMLSLWLTGLSSFKDKQYHHCVALLLPCLEHGLRRVFACVNHCPHRVLTAESTVLYTTFDEILSPTQPDKSPNKLPHEIGPRLMECLLDLLVQPEGPRLRDRLSHGEIDINSISKCLANHVISILVLFCSKYTVSPLSYSSEHYIARCRDVGRAYRPLFHPFSFLKREVIQLIEYLKTWSTISIPPEFTPPPPPLRGKKTEESNNVVRLSQALYDLLSGEGGSFGVTVSESLISSVNRVARLPHDVGVSETHQCSAALRELVESVWELVNGEEEVVVKEEKEEEEEEEDEREEEKEEKESQKMTHWSKAGLELIGLMRRSIENLATSVCQIRDMAVLRQRQHREKQLRSRQRKNYEHLITSLPLYRAGVCLVVAMIALTSLHVPRLSSGTDKIIKLFKKVQQVLENLSSQTSATKNRWEEADQLVISLTKLGLKDHLSSLIPHCTCT